MGEIIPLPFCLARASKLGGKRSRGRTKVWTLQGSFSGGVESSICTGEPKSLSTRTDREGGMHTVMPDSRCRANDLALVLPVVDNGPDAQAHNSQRWDLFRCFRISL